MLIGPLGTNFSEISMEIHSVLLKKVHLKLLSAKWQPFYLGLNVLTWILLINQDPRIKSAKMAYLSNIFTSMSFFQVGRYHQHQLQQENIIHHQLPADQTCTFCYGKLNNGIRCSCS